jgi:hypothetical protein
MATQRFGMTPRSPPRHADVAHHSLRLVRTSDCAEADYLVLLDAVRAAGIAVLGPERANRLFAEAAAEPRDATAAEDSAPSG